MRSLGWGNRVRTLALILGLAGASSLTYVEHAKGTDGAGKARAKAAYPLSFEKNQGQTDEAVEFLSRGSGYTLFLASTEAVLALGR